MTIKIWTYKQGSRSSRALGEALGARVLRREGGNWRASRGDFVINWGDSEMPQVRFAHGVILNEPGNVRIAANKLLAFQAMKEEGVSIPEFWTTTEEIPDDAFPIVCRTVLSGHSGAGIVIADDRASLVRAPLYVRYKKKQQEYRIHVGEGQFDKSIIAVQRKARNTDVPDADVNWQIRNLNGGFIFAREGVVAPDCVLTEAKRAIGALGLDFGGVDVIYNERERRAYVLEINTACGLEGQTVEDYAEFFRVL